MSPSKAHANELERTLAMNDVFDSHRLQHERERPDTVRKYMNSDKVQRKEPEFTTLINEVGGGTYVQNK